jgi:hypothetical protein
MLSLRYLRLGFECAYFGFFLRSLLVFLRQCALEDHEPRFALGFEFVSPTLPTQEFRHQVDVRISLLPLREVAVSKLDCARPAVATEPDSFSGAPLELTRRRQTARLKQWFGARHKKAHKDSLRPYPAVTCHVGVNGGPIEPLFRADSVVLAISVEKDGNLRVVYARIGRDQGRPAWRGA